MEVTHGGEMKKAPLQGLLAFGGWLLAFSF
jgi:hypothetical protein